MDEEREVFIIGEITFPGAPALNEALTTHLKSIGNCKIIVYGNEGTTPHFHVKSKTNNFETCLCIDEPRYFKHGHIQGSLTDDQLEELDKFLAKKNKKVPDRTNWQSVRDSWNYSDNEASVDNSLKEMKYGNANHTPPKDEEEEKELKNIRKVKSKKDKKKKGLKESTWLSNSLVD